MIYPFQYNNLSAQLDILHYEHKSFTTAIALKILFSNRNSPTSNLRNKFSTNFKVLVLIDFLLHISTPSIYHVNQKFKDPLKVYRVISKSHKIKSYLNFLRFSIIKSFSIIILMLTISIPSYYVPTFLLLTLLEHIHIES